MRLHWREKYLSLGVSGTVSPRAVMCRSVSTASMPSAAPSVVMNSLTWSAVRFSLREMPAMPREWAVTDSIVTENLPAAATRACRSSSGRESMMFVP